jgi:tryptophan synthase alpha subunit
MIPVPPETRFDAAFAARADDAPPGLIPYFTAGYPALGSLGALLHRAQRAGCLAAEVGIPFSDPLADGPTIQRTGQIALGNGMTLAAALTQVHDARAAGVTIPLALMTYVNPVLSFGIDAFAHAAASAGVDGAIFPDLPLELLDAVRTVTSLPRALGFGLSTHDHLVALRGHAEAAVVGSALLDALGTDPERADSAAAEFLKTMIGAEAAPAR